MFSNHPPTIAPALRNERDDLQRFAIRQAGAGRRALTGWRQDRIGGLQQRRHTRRSCGPGGRSSRPFGEAGGL